MLIFGRPILLENTLDQDKFEDPDYTTINVKDLGGHYKKLLNSMKSIEDMWNKQYLDALQDKDLKIMESSNSKKRNMSIRIPQIGDVVILVDEMESLGM